MEIKFDKIIRFELLFFLILVVLSFISFYFNETLPDNALSISSSSHSISFSSYYIVSIISYVGYFVGPWIIIPFILHTLSYAFLYSKRYYKWDSLNFIPLTSFFLLVFFCFSPEVLGPGLYYLIVKKMNVLELSFMVFISLGVLIAGVFRSSLKMVFLSLFNLLKVIPGQILGVILGFRPGGFFLKLENKCFDFFSSLKQLLLNGFKRRKGEVISIENKSFNEHRDVMPYRDEVLQEVERAKEYSAIDGQNNFNQDQEVGTCTKDDLSTQQSSKKGFLNQKKRSARQSAIEERSYYELVNALSKRKRKAPSQGGPNEKYFNDIIHRIEDKLNEFKIDGEIIRVLKGPVVDTFELELGPGVKVSKVTRAEDDLSLALYGAPIRIVYPMIGRTTVGIEVPRKPRDVIFLDEVLSSEEFKKTKLSLPIAMGKDAFGEIFVVDLGTMPHMLIAGATGAGKSVFINTLLVSLLVKKSPRQMQLILIDPKQLELALYANLPHLVVPVITDSKTAAISLMWAVQEMDRRYSILKEFGVRNIDSFNEKVKNAPSELFSKVHQYYENADQDGYELGYLVIIIDEFADLILTKAGKEIENNVCRLAAKARAAGIHLVVATQRPSVDVITGLIKSNFPTRVSFRVTSSIDSRTILNTVGAEKLLGMGDMLYKHGVTSCRLHSAFVDEKEVELFTDTIGSLPPTFNEQAMDFLENGGEQNDDPYAFGSHIQSVSQPRKDEKYEDALQMVIEHRSASASMLQRRLGIGYNRASNLIDELESNGIIGPAQGSKPRKVLTAQDIY